MHTPSKIGQFMTLRANGWSLDKIAKHINVSKGTLWSWDVKHQNEVHLLKHMQLERLQEQYLPSYEDELKSMANQLNRIEEALAKHDLSAMTPAFLMQMSLQYRDRLSKMRQQAPLRTVQIGPVEPLPVTGCVTHDEQYPWIAGDPAIEAAEDAAEAAERAETAAESDSSASASPAANPALAPTLDGRVTTSPTTTASEGRVTTSPAPTVQVPPLPTSGNHANGNGKPHHNGHMNGKHNGNGKPSGPASTIQQCNDSTPPIRVNPSSSVVKPSDSTIQRFNGSTLPENKTEQNRTKSEGGPKPAPSAATTYENQN